MAGKSGGNRSRRGSGSTIQPGGAKSQDPRAWDEILEACREDLIAVALGKALTDESVSLWKLLDRLMPAPSGRPVRLALPELRAIGDVNEAQIAVGVALACGVVTPNEASFINRGTIEPRRKMIETVELERRIAALEQRGAS